MEAVRSIAMSLCVTMVVTAIFSMLIPNNNFDKVLKFAVSLFFLIGLISPFVNQPVRFHIDEPTKESSAGESHLAAAVDNQFISLAEQKLASGVEHDLILQGISPKKVTAFINIADDGGISINKLIIVLRREDREKVTRTKSAVGDSTGMVPEVELE